MEKNSQIAIGITPCLMCDDKCIGLSADGLPYCEAHAAEVSDVKFAAVKPDIPFKSYDLTSQSTLGS